MCPREHKRTAFTSGVLYQVRVATSGGGNDKVSCWPLALARNVPRPEPGDARSSRSQGRSPLASASCYDGKAVDCHQRGMGGKARAAHPDYSANVGDQAPIS